MKNTKLIISILFLAIGAVFFKWGENVNSGNVMLILFLISVIFVAIALLRFRDWAVEKLLHDEYENEEI